jgi:hypothetical protein
VSAIDGDLCPLCGDALTDGDEDTHPECLAEWIADHGGPDTLTPRPPPADPAWRIGPDPHLHPEEEF